MRGKGLSWQRVQLRRDDWIYGPAQCQRVTHALTIFGKLRFCFHMVSYEFQNLEILQPLERTRLHIMGLNFEMSLFHFCPKEGDIFDEKKK